MRQPERGGYTSDCYVPAAGSPSHRHFRTIQPRYNDVSAAPLVPETVTSSLSTTTVRSPSGRFAQKSSKSLANVTAIVAFDMGARRVHCPESTRPIASRAPRGTDPPSWQGSFRLYTCGDAEERITTGQHVDSMIRQIRRSARMSVRSVPASNGDAGSQRRPQSSSARVFAARDTFAATLTKKLNDWMMWRWKNHAQTLGLGFVSRCLVACFPATHHAAFAVANIASTAHMAHAARFQSAGHIDLL